MDKNQRAFVSIGSVFKSLVDAGEAQAIALTQTTLGCIILLDDTRARKIAARLNIKQIGTIGLLLRAKRMGLIDKIRLHIEALIENGIYIRKQLKDAVLSETGEKSFVTISTR